MRAHSLSVRCNSVNRATQKRTLCLGAFIARLRAFYHFDDDTGDSALSLERFPHLDNGVGDSVFAFRKVRRSRYYLNVADAIALLSSL